MPAQQGVTNNGRDVGQDRAAQPCAEEGQVSPFRVGQTHASPAQLRLQSVLGSEVLDHLLLRRLPSSGRAPSGRQSCLSRESRKKRENQKGSRLSDHMLAVGGCREAVRAANEHLPPDGPPCSSSGIRYNTVLTTGLPMPVRLNITIDEDVHERLKQELPAKGISRFINDAIRARFRPSRAALDDAYKAAARERWRNTEARDWSVTDVEDWPA